MNRRRLLCLATAPLMILAAACSDSTVVPRDDGPTTSEEQVARVTVSPQSVSLVVGDTARLAAVVTGTRGTVLGQGVQYRSANPGVATVSGGVVVGRGGGATSIIAAAGAVADTVNVTVAAAAPPETPWQLSTLVKVRFDGTPPTSDVVAAFTAAAARINSLMQSTSGATAVRVNVPAGACDESQGRVDETVPGLLIVAAVRPIDGPGSTLGLAGPCIVRSGTKGIPALGIMAFDETDMAQMASRGILDGVILHEMLHVLGIGTLWGPGYQALVDDPDGQDPLFRGQRASGAYGVIGALNAMLGVPVENTGGTGTRGGHWRESVFRDELMTGWVGGSMQLSSVTLAALGDMGYDVDVGKADPYTLSSLLGSSTMSLAAPGPGTHLKEAAIGPILRIDRDGTIH